jgi:hypothetical protein
LVIQCVGDNTNTGQEIYFVACLAITLRREPVSSSQITEAVSEFLLLMGEIRQRNFCQAVVVRIPIFYY